MPNALKLFYDYREKYARRAILHVYVTAKRNFIIRIGETLLKYICTKNDEDLSERHADNDRRVSVEEQLISISAPTDTVLRVWQNTKPLCVQYCLPPSDRNNANI